jgi:hypothetical protein
MLHIFNIVHPLSKSCLHHIADVSCIGNTTDQQRTACTIAICLYNEIEIFVCPNLVCITGFRMCIQPWMTDAHVI